MSCVLEKCFDKAAALLWKVYGVCICIAYVIKMENCLIVGMICWQLNEEENNLELSATTGYLPAAVPRSRNENAKFLSLLVRMGLYRSYYTCRYVTNLTATPPANTASVASTSHTDSTTSVTSVIPTSNIRRNGITGKFLSF